MKKSTAKNISRPTAASAARKQATSTKIEPRKNLWSKPQRLQPENPVSKQAPKSSLSSLPKRRDPQTPVHKPTIEKPTTSSLRKLTNPQRATKITKSIAKGNEEVQPTARKILNKSELLKSKLKETDLNEIRAEVAVTNTVKSPVRKLSLSTPKKSSPLKQLLASNDSLPDLVKENQMTPGRLVSPKQKIEIKEIETEYGVELEFNEIHDSENTAPIKLVDYDFTDDDLTVFFDESPELEDKANIFFDSSSYRNDLFNVSDDEPVMDTPRRDPTNPSRFLQVSDELNEIVSEHIHDETHNAEVDSLLTKLVAFDLKNEIEKENLAQNPSPQKEKFSLSELEEGEIEIEDGEIIELKNGTFYFPETEPSPAKIQVDEEISLRVLKKE